MSFKLIKSKPKEQKYIKDRLVEFNAKCSLFTQKPAFIDINFVIKNDEGKIIAGINSHLYCWQCLYINILWVDENYRKEGLGSRLIQKAEKEAKSKGGYLVHLTTFDWQARDFYQKHGYEIFGEIKDNPKGHSQYFLKKNI